MTLQHLTIGVLFALSLVTLTLALATTAHADDLGRRADAQGRTFVAERLAFPGKGLEFGLAPEIWSRSLHDLVALLARVRAAGYSPARRARVRPVTLAEAMQLRERRRQVIEELALTVD